MCLEPFPQAGEAFLVPALRLGHGDPTIEIVGRGIDMPDAARGRCGGHHVADLLDESDDRYPADFRRNVRASRLLHPSGRTPQAGGLEKNDWIGGVLQNDHSHWTPTRVGLVKFVALRSKVEERLVAKTRPPDRATGCTGRGHPAPGHAVPRRPRPERTLIGV